MGQSKHVRARVRVLVKAFPQHSDKYDETVCCAGVTEDNRLIRLYPITYRRLLKENQFNRFDLIEALLTKASNDVRPEIYRVDHDSIKVVDRGTGLSDEPKVRLWQPHIVPSVTALQDEYRVVGRSLGIIRPDPGSLEFSWKVAEKDEQEDARGVQASLLDEPLRPLKPPEFTFFYRYTSGDKEHTQSIQDWEVQATYQACRRQYGSRDQALEIMSREYGDNIPKRNVHFIMGNMAKRQWQFIVIGLLRSGLDPDEVARQGQLF